MSKNKKIIFGSLALSLIFLGSFFLVRSPEAKALSTNTMNLLKSINILGLSVVQSGSVKYSAIDMSNATSSLTFNLPALSGNNGMIYFVKKVGTSNENYILLQPASGDMINNYSDRAIFNTNDYVILFADEVNSNWWVLNSNE